MAIREIIFMPDPILRRKARRVAEFDKEFQTLVDDMVETMRVAPGVGLAAPQIGISTRLIVVEYVLDEDEDGEENAPKKLYVVANPEIIQSSAETEPGTEACLSVQGLVGEVQRPTQITVKGLNRHGRPVRLKLEGWLARIFQHEIDHLEGVLFVDRATRVWKPSENEMATIAD